jgi:hypothetical protein
VITGIILEDKLPNFDSGWFDKFGTTFTLIISADKVVYLGEIIQPAESADLNRNLE